MIILSWWYKAIAYGFLILGTLAIDSFGENMTFQAASSVPGYFERLGDRVPELIAAIIVIWLVFRFLEHTHTKVGKSLDNMTRAVTSLEQFLRERLAREHFYPRRKDDE